MSTFKTAKGTVLPILLLKGKEYLEVKYRLVWFREEHPDYGIETEFLEHSANLAIARATIRDASGRILAQGTKSETPKGFPDYIEKSESGAIGRALALIGYGTQFCADELDEGERVVDSPIPPRGKPSPKSESMPHFPSPVAAASDDPGEYVMPFGKWKGTRLADIDMYDLDGYCRYIVKDAKDKGKAITGQVAQALAASEAYLVDREYDPSSQKEGA